MDERRRVLEMVAEGTITIEDGERLLEALLEGHAPVGSRHASETAEEHLQRAIGTAISSAIEDGIGAASQTKTLPKRRAAGSIDDIISFASHGVSANFVRELRGIWPDLGPDDVIELASNGVRSEFIREVRELWPDIQPDEFVELACNGVRSDYIRSARAVWPDLTTDDLISLSSHGVRPDEMAKLADLIHGLSFEDMIELSSHGVTAGYVQTLVESGITGLSADDIVDRVSEDE